MQGLVTALHVLGAAGVGRGDLVGRMSTAVALAWAIGFEREVRGSDAGDRTFALVGLGSAVIGYLALNGAPNALAGVITGVGFLGAGVMIRGGSMGDPMVHGITTAATFYLAAAVGAAAGQGELLLATYVTVAAIVLLEVRHLRFLQFLDGRNLADRLASEQPPIHRPPGAEPPDEQ